MIYKFRFRLRLAHSLWTKRSRKVIAVGLIFIRPEIFPTSTNEKHIDRIVKRKITSLALICFNPCLLKCTSKQFIGEGKWPPRGPFRLCASHL